MANMMNCPFCGRLTDPKLDSCVHCGGVFRKGAGPAPKSRSGESATCPNCGAYIQEGDIICVACGTNLLTGQKITQAKTSASSTVTTSKESSPWLTRIAIGAIVVIILAGAVYGLMVLLHDPIAKAEKLYAAGKPLEAMKLLETHIKSKPDDALAQFTLGRFHWLNAEFAEAAQSFESASKINKQDTKAAFAAALSYARLKTEDGQKRATGALEQLVERSPSDFDAWFLLGQLRGVLGDGEGQIAALTKAIDLEPAHARARMALGVARALSGKYTDASNDLTLAQKQFESDNASGETLANLYAANGFIFDMLGLDEQGQGAFDAALQGQTGMKGASMVQLGLQALLRGNLADAEGLFKRAVDANTKDDAARFFAAVCAEAQGFPQDALPVFEALSKETGPFASAALAQAASIYLDTGQAVQAQEAIDKAISQNATGPIAYTIRGRILAKAGDISGAREAFATAIRTDPAYAPARLENGLLLIQRGMLAEAVQELDAYTSQVNPALPNARIEEVKTLVAQLKETMAAGQAPAAPAETAPQPETTPAAAADTPAAAPPIPGSSQPPGSGDAPAPSVVTPPAAESNTTTPPVGAA